MRVIKSGRPGEYLENQKNIKPLQQIPTKLKNDEIQRSLYRNLYLLHCSKKSEEPK